eukprot:7125508-Pyramimonas_sp.AAC.1
MGGHAISSKHCLCAPMRRFTSAGAGKGPASRGVVQVVAKQERPPPSKILSEGKCLIQMKTNLTYVLS